MGPVRARRVRGAVGAEHARSPLFFGAGLLGLAFADIVLLAVSVVATIVLFARVSRLAAVLLVPYLAWVGFASALNFAIWQLN